MQLIHTICVRFGARHSRNRFTRKKLLSPFSFQWQLAEYPPTEQMHISLDASSRLLTSFPDAIQSPIFSWAKSMKIFDEFKFFKVSSKKTSVLELGQQIFFLKITNKVLSFSFTIFLKFWKENCFCFIWGGGVWNNKTYSKLKEVQFRLGNFDKNSSK